MTPAERIKQREAALAQANSTRIAIARFKFDVAGLPHDEGVSLVADVLETTDAGQVEAIKVRHLLCAVRLIGSGKALRHLREAGVYNGDLQIRQLTRRQRLALAQVVREPDTSQSIWPRTPRSAA